MMPATESGNARRISALVPDPRQEGTVRIQVEGRTILTVPEAQITRLGLEVGSTLEGDLGEELGRAADAEAAYQALLVLLARRPYAARDLARRLVLRGHPPAAADAAVIRAEGTGLVDDEAFARHFIQTRSARGRGPARLRRELTGMGVASGLVDHLLAQEMPDGGSPERIRSLAGRRATQLEAVPRPARFRRVVAYLARRGYTGPEVRRTVREVLGGSRTAD
jgi:regulatory protein